MSVFDPKADASAIQPLVDETTQKVTAALESLGQQVSGKLVDAITKVSSEILISLPHLLEGYVVTVNAITIGPIAISPIVVKVTRAK